MNSGLAPMKEAVMKTMNRITLLTLSLLLGFAAHGVGQGVDPPPPEVRISAALQAANEAGVPASVLELKVKEGELKQVPPVRIAEAVESLLGALITADGFLRRVEPERVPPTADLTVTAGAILAGIELDAIERLRRETPPDQRTVAVSVLADVVRLGVAPDAAAVEVRDAVRGGADALLGLPARVRARRGGGG